VILGIGVHEVAEEDAVDVWGGSRVHRDVEPVEPVGVSEI